MSRFSEPNDPIFRRLDSSISYDRRLGPHDVAQSRAHATMLAAAGIIGEDERDVLLGGLDQVAAELEQVLLSHPAVRDAAVAGVPDEAAGERPKAWIVTAGAVDEAELAEYVEAQVAPYKRLVAIEVVDELPRTMTGKLLRRVLLERERTAVAVSP